MELLTAEDIVYWTPAARGDHSRLFAALADACSPAPSLGLKASRFPHCPSPPLFSSLRCAPFCLHAWQHLQPSHYQAAMPVSRPVPPRFRLPRPNSRPSHGCLLSLCMPFYVTVRPAPCGVERGLHGCRDPPPRASDHAHTPRPQHGYIISAFTCVQVPQALGHAHAWARLAS